MNIKKGLKYFFIVTIILLIITIFLFNRMGKQIYGALTEQVDYEQFEPQIGSFAVANVNVLSEEGDRFITGQTVTIKDGLIQTIDSVQAVSDQYTIIDGSGKYLIPGLIDAHVHLFQSPNDLLLYVANGITEIRELIGEEDHLKWKQQIENGRIGPKMFVATPRLGSFSTMEGFFMEQSQGFINVRDAASARQTIQRLHAEGYQGVKIYSQLNRESYIAIAETAKELDMPIFGHIPWAASYDDIYNHGQSGIAHFEEVMNALAREFDDYGNFGGREDEFLDFINDRSDELAQNLIKNNITVTSTLWLTESFEKQKFDLKQILKNVELVYQNPGISEWSTYIPGGLGWLPEVNRYKLRDGLTPEELNSEKKFWSTYGQACALIANNLNQRGVKIMAGTDTNLPPTVPGFSLHDELGSLNRAGLTTQETLRAATSTPASWLRSRSGKVAIGYDANLVLLDKNPLDAIEHTKAINTVILKGKVFDRSLLDQMLTAVKDANDRSRKIPIDEFL